jgi:hypothetical protein
MNNLNAFAKFSGSQRERNTSQSTLVSATKPRSQIQGAMSVSALGSMSPKRYDQTNSVRSSNASLLQGAMSHSVLSSAYSKTSLSPQKDQARKTQAVGSTSNLLKTLITNRSPMKQSIPTSTMNNASSVSALDRAKVHLSGDRSSIKDAISMRQSINHLSASSPISDEDGADDELKQFLNKLSSPEKLVQTPRLSQGSRKNSDPTASYLKPTPKSAPSPPSSSQGSRRSSVKLLAVAQKPLETILSSDFMMSSMNSNNEFNMNNMSSQMKESILAASESDMSSIGSDFDMFMSSRDASPVKSEFTVLNDIKDIDEFDQNSESKESISSIAPQPAACYQTSDMKQIPHEIEEATIPIESTPSIARILFNDSPNSATDISESSVSVIDSDISSKSEQLDDSIRMRSNIRTLDDLMNSFSLEESDQLGDLIQIKPRIQSPVIQNALLQSNLTSVDEMFPSAEDEELQARHDQQSDEDSVYEDQQTPKASLLAPNPPLESSNNNQQYGPGYSYSPYPPPQPHLQSHPHQHSPYPTNQQYQYPLNQQSPYPPYPYYGPPPGCAWGPQYPHQQPQFSHYYQNTDSTCNNCGHDVGHKKKSKKHRSKEKIGKNTHAEKKSSKKHGRDEQKKDHVEEGKRSKSSKSIDQHTMTKRSSKKSEKICREDSEIQEDFIAEQIDSISSNISDYKESVIESEVDLSSSVSNASVPTANIPVDESMSLFLLIVSIAVICK